MDSAFRSAIPDSSLAAIAQLSENSRLGFAGRNPALHRGIEWSKSTLALGLPEWSGKTASDHVVPAKSSNILNKVVAKICSKLPDVTQLGIGGDLAVYAGEGGQLTLNANGRSGELTLSFTHSWDLGFIGPDAYGFVGVVWNAPTNKSLAGGMITGGQPVLVNAGERTGVQVNPRTGDTQFTVGPSALPFTRAMQANGTVNLATVRYAGYLLNETKGLCTLTGH